MPDNALFNKAVLQDHLQRLKEDTAPAWGIMTARHMVEHLTETIKFSNGINRVDLAIPFEKAERAKARMLAPEWTMPREFKAAFMPTEGLPQLKFSSLSTAIEALFSEIDDFYAFFALNPDATPTHAYFGDLNKSEWEINHHKHIAHHFEQFGLIMRAEL
jgi:oxepin-CoA hydrolase / 3-oxo-5,6-dehydrosuberyl-CoA semialdehyde dehydrogenase